MRQRIIQEDIERILQAPFPWLQFQGKTVLVTGAAGFLPAYMVETLLCLNEQNRDQKTTVIALVRNLEKARRRFAHHLDRKDLRFLVQDASSPVAADFPIHFIIHAASQASPRQYGTDPVGTMSANILGTSHLLELASRNGPATVLYLSSSEVYGALDAAHMPVAEHTFGSLDPANVRSCYAESKRAAETICTSWAHQHGVPAKIVRPFHTYGPGLSLDDGRVFADFVADILAGRAIAMHSDGSARRAFCYIADAVEGFFAVLLKGIPGTAYNIGNPDAESSILDLAERLVVAFPEKRLSVVRADSAPPPGYLDSRVSVITPDIRRARLLGWQPRIGIEEGFRRTVESFE